MSNEVTPPSANEGSQESIIEKSGKKPWYKRPIPLIILGVLLISFISSMNGGSGETTSSTNSEVAASPESSQPDPVQPSVPGIGDAVRDGKFEFTVNSVKCGITSVGSDFLKTTPQGEFCKVSLTVSNIGNEAQMMSSDNTYAYDAKGRKFSASSDVLMSDESGSKFFLEDINPGNSVSGSIYFDVPVGESLVKIELHDSMFSNGVEVQL